MLVNWHRVKGNRVCIAKPANEGARDASAMQYAKVGPARLNNNNSDQYLHRATKVSGQSQSSRGHMKRQQTGSTG